MRSENQNADTRHLTAEELDLVQGGSFWGYVGAVLGGIVGAATVIDAEKNAEAKKGMHS